MGNHAASFSSWIDLITLVGVLNSILLEGWGRGGRLQCTPIQLTTHKKYITGCWFYWRPAYTARQAPNFLMIFLEGFIHIKHFKLLKIFNKHCKPFEAIECLNKNEILGTRLCFKLITLIYTEGAVTVGSDSLLQHTFMVKYANRYLPVQWESSQATYFQRFLAAIFSSGFLI